MRRREFIVGVAGVAAWPLTVQAQSMAMPVVGLLVSYPLDQASRPLMLAFRDGLREAGFEAGKNATIEYLSAEGHYDRLPALAEDLVRHHVTVIAAIGGSPAAAAAKSATRSIPIVFQVGVDPVQMGLVSSLNHPGGNLTGIANLSLTLGPKRLELLHELRPTATLFAVLANPYNPAAITQSSEMQAAAKALGIDLHMLYAGADHDFDTVFGTAARLRAGGIVISGDAFFNSRGDVLGKLSLRYAVPAVYQFREFAAAGGLLSYGSSLTEAYRLAGGYTGRILKGEKPFDLPIQQSTKAELIVNLSTAKALGIEVPQALLARADEVIE